MTPYIGQLLLVGWNFAPPGWAFCNGQLQSIAQNTALFSLLGTTYGGDGIRTFALPDLRGRGPIHFGTSTTGSSFVQGEVSGTESTTLLVTQLPQHTHALMGNRSQGNSNAPSGAVLAADGPVAPPAGPYVASLPNTTLSVRSVGVAGGSQPTPIMQPFLAMNWVIALQGIFPSRG